MTEVNKPRPRASGRPKPVPWRRMTLRYVGKIDEVIETGGGKLSVAGGDPGEPRKTKPSG